MRNITLFKNLFLVVCLFAGTITGCGSQDANEAVETEKSASVPSESSNDAANQSTMKNLPPQPLSADGQKMKGILIDWTEEMFAIVNKIKTAGDGAAAGSEIGESVDKLIADLKSADIKLTTQLMVDVQADPEFKTLDVKMGDRMNDLKNNYPEAHAQMQEETFQHMMRLSSEIEKLVKQNEMQATPDAGQ